MEKKVFVIDDHPIFREGIKALIDHQIGLRLVGEADSSDKIVEQIQELNPDIILLDLSLQNGSGLQMIKSIRFKNRHTGILVVSMHSDLVYAERVIRLGANGYINKNQTPQNLLSAIWLVLGGKLYVCREVAERLLQRQLGSNNTGIGDPAEILSNRELEVFAKIGCGLTSKSIASQLNVSTKTVDSHREHIKRKLGLSNSSALVQLAVTWVNRE